MQIIHITEEGIGSFDWEMPSEFVGKLSQLDEDAQKAVRHVVTQQIRGHLYLLMGALNMREKAMEALDEISATNISLLQSLLAKTK